MTSKTNTFRIPVIASLLLTVGVGWLLTALEVIPGVNWAWTLGLAVVGLLIPIIGGLDKLTVVAGPFLMSASVFSLLRQLRVITVATESPLLVMTAGALLFIPHYFNVPKPSWLLEDGR